VKRNVRRLVGAAVAVAAVLGGIRAAMVWNNHREVLPTFVAVPEGARAPAFELGGVSPGATSLAQVQQQTQALGWTCSDTSMRGLMQLGRTQVQHKMAEAAARGDDPDTVSGASRAHYVSKKERNPQVQWNCEDVDLGQLGQGLGGGEHGNALFIFDSPRHPLRVVTLSRKYFSQQAALTAFDAARGRFAALGASTRQGEPNRTRAEAKVFARSMPVSETWRFADRQGQVAALNMGPKRGIDVREVWEVPWPVTVGEPLDPKTAVATLAIR
jgi:hypothetical protein